MKTFKVAVLISGNGSNLQALIDNFKEEESIGDINCVISNKKDAFGLERAARASIYNHFVDHTKFKNRETFDQELIQILDGYDPDLIVLAGFLKKIPLIYIDYFKKMIINIHPALLPSYGGKGMYGMNIHKAVIENNETKSGITIHFVNKNYDEGKILFQKAINLEGTESSESLSRKILKLEHKFFPKIIEKALNNG